MASAGLRPVAVAQRHRPIEHVRELAISAEVGAALELKAGELAVGYSTLYGDMAGGLTC